MSEFIKKLFKKNIEKSILDDERFNPNTDEQINIKNENKINYMRIPLAKNSWISFLYSIIAFFLSYLAIRISILLKGNTELYIVAIIFSSLIFSISSLFYIHRSFKEKQVKQILSYISLFLSGIQIVLWLIIMIIGGTK